MNTCVGCKFMYHQCYGYSNYTVTDYDILCAKDKNPNLPAREPFDWKKNPDNWDKTCNSRCNEYSPGEMVSLDVEGEDGPADYTDDVDAIEAICKHSGRNKNGGFVSE